MFIPFWLLYLLCFTVALALFLQAQSIYIVDQAKTLRKGITSSTIWRLSFNFLIALAINGYIIYYIFTSDSLGIR